MAESDSTRRDAVVAALGVGLLLALGYLSRVTIDGPWRLWAFDSIRYLPWWAGVAMGGLSLAAMLFIEKADWSRPVGRRAAWGMAIGSTLFFVIMTSRYAFLGDNLRRALDAELGRVVDNELGMSWLFRGGTALLRSLEWGAGREFIRAVSYVSGPLFVGLTLLFARREKAPWLCLLGALGGGIVEFFCGYVESYPLVLVAILAAVAAAWFAARGALPGVVALLVLVVAALLHRVAVLFAPAVLIPLVARDRDLSRRFVIAVLLLPMVVMSAASLVPSLSSALLLPWSGGSNPAYTLVSAAHLSDYLNAQALGSFAGFLLAPLALWFLLREEARCSASRAVLLLAWWMPAIALFFFRPKLGAADWDLLALATPFAFLFGAGVIGERAPRWLGRAVILSWVVTLPWLLVQRGEASIPRIANLIGHDRGDYYLSHPPEMQLAFLYGGNDLEALQEEMLKRGVIRFPRDARYPYSLSALYRSQRRWSDAEHAALDAYGLERGYILPLDVLYDVYKATGRPHDQFTAGMAILEAHQSQKEAVERYLSTTRLAQIEREVRAIGPDPSER